MSWLIYAQAVLFGVILLRQALRPFTDRRRATRAERLTARILRESRDMRKTAETTARERPQLGS